MYFKDGKTKKGNAFFACKLSCGGIFGVEMRIVCVGLILKRL